MAKLNGKANKKYILRRAKNGRRREKRVGAAVYGIHKDKITRMANEYGRKVFGYREMSVSAFINIKLGLLEFED